MLKKINVKVYKEYIFLIKMIKDFFNNYWYNEFLLIKEK